jgi:hypothetical protein
MLLELEFNGGILKIEVHLSGEREEWLELLMLSL